MRNKPFKKNMIQVPKWLFGITIILCLLQLGLLLSGFYTYLTPQDTQPENTVVAPSLPALPTYQPLPELPPLPEGFRTPTLPQLESFTFTPSVSSRKERDLLLAARKARMSGDMRVVALKLNETLRLYPQSIHARYQLAEMYEFMGIYSKATTLYEFIFDQGVTAAGPLYSIAARKLRDGYGSRDSYRERLIIGHVDEFVDPSVTAGEKVTLTFPLIADPSADIDPKLVQVSIKTYDSLNDEVVPALPSNQVTTQWQRNSQDWNHNGEEFLSATYYLPRSRKSKDLASLGARAYHGYLIELRYNDEIIDQVAWPRLLLNTLQQQELQRNPFGQDGSMINYDNLLLPPTQ